MHLRRLLDKIVSLLCVADDAMPQWMRVIPGLLSEHVHGQMMLMQGRYPVAGVTVDIGFQSPRAATAVDRAAHAIAAAVTVISVEMLADDHSRCVAYDYPFYGDGGENAAGAKHAHISNRYLLLAAQEYAEALWTTYHGTIDVYAQAFECRRTGIIKQLAARSRIRVDFLDGGRGRLVFLSRCCGAQGEKTVIAVGATVRVWCRCTIRREAEQRYHVTYDDAEEVPPCSENHDDIRPVVTADQLRRRYCDYISVLVWRAYGRGGGPTLLSLDAALNKTPSHALHARMLRGAHCGAIASALLCYLAGVAQRTPSGGAAVRQWLMSPRTSRRLIIYIFYHYDALIRDESSLDEATSKAIALGNEYVAAARAAAAAAAAALFAASLTSCPRRACTDGDRVAERMQELIDMLRATSNKRKAGGAQHTPLLIAVAMIRNMCLEIRERESASEISRS
jgi:hypothetical protein